MKMPLWITVRGLGIGTSRRCGAPDCGGAGAEPAGRSVLAGGTGIRCVSFMMELQALKGRVSLSNTNAGAYRTFHRTVTTQMSVPGFGVARGAAVTWQCTSRRALFNDV